MQITILGYITWFSFCAITGVIYGFFRGYMQDYNERFDFQSNYYRIKNNTNKESECCWKCIQ